MTDDTRDTQNDNPTANPDNQHDDAAYQAPPDDTAYDYGGDYDEADVDAAIAAIASLSELAADDTDDTDDTDDIDDIDDADDTDENAARRQADTDADAQPTQADSVQADDNYVVRVRADDNSPQADAATQTSDTDDDWGLSYAAAPVPAATPLDAPQPRSHRRRTADVDVVAPRMTAIQRGQAASAIPGLLLIVVGTWLTLTLSSGGSISIPWLPFALAGAGVGVALLSHWVTSRRSARGSFFMGVLALALTALTIVLLQPASPGLVQGWPLYIGAMGTGFFLTGLFNAASSRLLFIGVMLLMAGTVGFALTANIIDAAPLAPIAQGWPVLLVIVVLLLLTPLVRGLRR